jgi:hypothetical protein
MSLEHKPNAFTASWLISESAGKLIRTSRPIQVEGLPYTLLLR